MNTQEIIVTVIIALCIVFAISRFFKKSKKCTACKDKEFCKSDKKCK